MQVIVRRRMMEATGRIPILETPTRTMKKIFSDVTAGRENGSDR